MPQRLPIVNADDGQWGTIIRQFLMKEHYNDDTDNTTNGGHQFVTIRSGSTSAAPLRLTSSGSSNLLSTPSAGAVEFDTDTLYVTTTTGPTRKKVALYDDSAGAAGDLHYRDASGNFVRLGAGAANTLLNVSGSLPAWTSTLTGVSISGSTNTITNLGVSALAATAYGTVPTANELSQWDANKNLAANVFAPGFTTTVTSATAVVLTVASTQVQSFTGSTAQTVRLPTTSVSAGTQWVFLNNSTVAITVTNAAGSVTVGTVAAGANALFIALIATPAAATDWDTQYDATMVAGGKTLAVNASLTLNGTDGTAITFPTASDTVVTLAAVQTLSAKTLTSPTINTPTVNSPVLGAGTTTTAPLKFSAGTNLTTATAGSIEYDGAAFYADAAASTRQVMRADQFITQTAAYTLTSQTAAQKLFNASTNGAVTLPLGTYFFDCFYTLSAMSATSGSFGWTLAAGTAAIAGIMWQSEGNKAALATAAASQTTVNTAANTAIVTANTTATGWANIWGKVRISTAGTVIPQVSLGVAAAAVVGVDSYFRIWSVGTNTVTTVGNWS